jgi:hypothetical protein
MIWPVEWGVLGQLWAGTSPEGALLNGKASESPHSAIRVHIHGSQYIAPWGKVRMAREDVDDSSSGKELWTWLEEQVHAHARAPAGF